MIGIKAISSFFSDKKVYAKDLIADGDLDENGHNYFSNIGIDSIYDAGQYQGYDLAKQATGKLLNKAAIEGADIDFIIYIQNRLPEHLMSSNAARLQFEIGAVKANALSISDLGCTDMSMAIKLARDFLVSNTQAENVLICYGNKPYAPSRFRFPVTINGDGGIALLIARTNNNRIVDVQIKTKGNYWDLFKVDYQNKCFADYREECTSYRKYGFELAIESKLRLGELNEYVFKLNGIGKNDIQHYLLQNLSNRSYEFYESSFDIKFSKICQHNLNRYGHLGPADVMLNYLTGLETGSFQKNEKVLIMNNSPVASWSNILIEV